MADQKITALASTITLASGDLLVYAKVSTSVTTAINYVSLSSVVNDNTSLTGNTTIQVASISGNLNVAGNALVIGAASALGYGAGAGGTVTQSVGGRKEISVALNRAVGTIIMSNSVMAASVMTSVLFGNSVLGINDVLVLNYTGNGATGANKRSYVLAASVVSPGAAVINVLNNQNFADASSVFIQFAVVKGAIT